MAEWVAIAVGAAIGLPSWLAWWAARRAREEAIESKRLQVVVNDGIAPIRAELHGLHDQLATHLQVADREHRALDARIRNLEHAR